MIRKLFPVFIILIACMVISVPAQENKTITYNPTELVRPSKGFLYNLIDPNKFEMSQSYSLSFLSGGGRTMNQGLYLNTMSYQFSDPLSVQLRFGFLHQPFGQFSNQNEQSPGEFFLQGARLQYQPMKNMTITMDYQVYPAGIQSPYYGYRNMVLSRILDD